MQESVKAALTVVKSQSESLDINFESFEKKDLHVHFPAGAISKDGPSAGIAIVTAITSALTNKGVSGKIAMTGEVSLHGDVLPIGGLQEKLSAAVRGKIETVIIPKENQKDLIEIDQEIKDKLNICFAKTVSDVFKEVFV
jgi:ATP-dependent Lon protease